jgi:hypothetical protein
VTDYILCLAQGLGGRTRILEIVYDQWQSQIPISELQKKGYYAMETCFTNEYKREMYGSFLQLAEEGKIQVCGMDEKGHVEQFLRQLKALEREQKGDRIYYHHPTSGPVQHDDYVSAVANLIYRLSLLVRPTVESLQKNRRNGGPPRPSLRRVMPVKGSLLWGGQRGNILLKLRDRL